MSATTDDAAEETAAATDREADRTGDHLSNAGDSIEATADKAGNAVANGADRAADATGELIVKVRKKLKD